MNDAPFAIFRQKLKIKDTEYDVGSRTVVVKLYMVTSIVTNLIYQGEK